MNTIKPPIKGTSEFRLLNKIGADALQLSFTSKFKLVDEVRNYQRTTSKTKAKTYKADKSIARFNTAIDEILTEYTSFTMCITQDINDKRPKAVAGSIIQSLIKDDRGASNSIRWHRIDNSFNDKLLKRRDKSIKLLIISGIHMSTDPDFLDSSDTKYRKLRDILELYSDIPRIVLACGDTPHSLFDYMQYPLDFPLFLRSQTVVRS